MDEFQSTANRIRKYFEDLEEYRGLSLDEKRDYYAASMVVFSIINESLMCSELFMAKKHFGAPSTYKEMIDALAQKGIVEQGLAGRMKVLITLRNMISHEYGEIKPKDIVGLIRKIDVAREFVSALAKKY
ncbi:hypothetical protein COV61_01855 [Candidatus Micrarchaeota archaeon CG11_big_fil_rev_8_21_14_0_20_47_5]|nr:MAG: hypothetical protein AUJ17_00620 [Candidatus Micrarchaeota archaeon CG1_02_47_40]PIN83860.1 MAG: hypothetical protein COV61_01855 [Candidatus Micrarchaeota archaeon CG11_big_fil_rev_8_21_14_0_20_47_5]